MANNKVQIEVLLQLQDVNRKLKTLEKSVKQGTEGIKKGFDGVNLSLVNLQAGLSVLQTAWEKTQRVLAPGLGLDTALAEVRTLSGSTADELASLQTTIEQYSLSIPQSATELANGLYQTISAGITDTGLALDVLQVSAKAAVAGLTDTFASVDLITTVLNSYSLEASQAGRVSDVLFGTVKAGKTRFDELASSVGRLTPLAAQAGVTIEELFAALATLTAGGLPTREAVTRLAAVMSSFIKPSENAKVAARELGVELNSAGLKSLGLAGVLEQIRDKTDGNIDAVTSLIEREEALTAILALTGSQFDQFGRNLDAINGSLGATEEAFGIMADTGENSIVIIVNQFKILSSFLAEGFIPILQVLINLIGDRDGIIESLKLLGTIAATVAVSMGTYRVATILATLSTASFAASVTTLAVSFEALALSLAATPIGIITLLAGAITAGTAGYYLFGAGAREAADGLADMTRSGQEAIKVLRDLEGRANSTFQNLSIDDLAAEVERLDNKWYELFRAGAPEFVLKNVRDELDRVIERMDQLAEAKRAADQAMLESGKLTAEQEEALVKGSLKRAQEKADEENAIRNDFLKKRIQDLKEDRKNRIAALEAAHADELKAEEIRASQSIETQTSWLIDQLDILEEGSAQWEAYFAMLRQLNADWIAAQNEETMTGMQHWVDLISISAQTAGTYLGETMAGAGSALSRWRGFLKTILIATLDAVKAQILLAEAFAVAKGVLNPGAIIANAAKIAGVEALFAVAKALVMQYTAYAQGGVIASPTLALMGEGAQADILYPEITGNQYLRDKVAPMMVQAAISHAGSSDPKTHKLLQGMQEKIDSLSIAVTKIAPKATAKAIANTGRALV